MTLSGVINTKTSKSPGKSKWLITLPDSCYTSKLGRNVIFKSSMSLFANVLWEDFSVNMIVFFGFSHHSANRFLENPHCRSGVLASTSLFRLGEFIWLSSCSDLQSFMCLKSNGLLRPTSNDWTIFSFIHSTWDLAHSITLVET